MHASQFVLRKLFFADFRPEPCLRQSSQQQDTSFASAGIGLLSAISAYHHLGNDFHYPVTCDKNI
jgi:hypothetical protein